MENKQNEKESVNFVNLKIFIVFNGRVKKTPEMNKVKPRRDHNDDEK